ncbi:hypothetical protein F0521_17570 [Ferrimonas sp. YFM]|nr:hypothetical protein F0521_17570 [Ferrimonas sp. YFM]
MFHFVPPKWSLDAAISMIFAIPTETTLERTLAESRGKRQSERSVSAILTAFSELLSERQYHEISIAQIVERANLGRTTFYRHFQAKVDALVAVHHPRVNRLLVGLEDQATWLADEAPAGMIETLEAFQSKPGMRLSLMHTFGRDGDQLLRRMSEQLTSGIKQRLTLAFSQRQWAIPSEMLAAALVANFEAQIRVWIAVRHRLSAKEFADQLHQLNRGLVLAALGQQA